jgi:hypothetical protein
MKFPLTLALTALITLTSAIALPADTTDTTDAGIIPDELRDALFDYFFPKNAPLSCTRQCARSRTELACAQGSFKHKSGVSCLTEGESREVLLTFGYRAVGVAVRRLRRCRLKRNRLWQSLFGKSCLLRGRTDVFEWGN